MKKIVLNLRLLLAFVLSPFTDRAGHQPPNFANIKALLLHLCDYDDVKCTWVMRWLAYPLRNPGAKMDIGLVVNGEEGTGKNMFFEQVVARLYNDDSVRHLDAARLHATLQRWAVGARLAMVDGTFSKKNAARLKELITAAALHVAGRFEQGQTRKNRINFVFLSTSSEFLPVLESDRRLFVLEVGPRQTRTFYRAVSHEIANGGVEAFREYLMRGLDMSGFNEHTRPPADAAQRALREVA
jgi:hypothetical protein